MEISEGARAVYPLSLRDMPPPFYRQWKALSRPTRAAATKHFALIFICIPLIGNSLFEPREYRGFRFAKRKRGGEGVPAIEQYEKMKHLPTGKGRRIAKIPRPFFLTSTAFVDTNAYSEMFCFRKT